MKVFISWSGPLSQRLAEALRGWLPTALQFVKPYFSPEDIEKGAKWGTEISKELASSDMGLICLTQENTESPWILFEAGALSKSLEHSRVCTLLFNLEPADFKGPLTDFQATRFAKGEFKRLVTTINAAARESGLESSVLESVFDMWWPRLEAEVTAILASPDGGPTIERRSDRDILEELLELTRTIRSQSMQPRLSERAIVDLMEAVGGLQMVINHESEEAVILRALRKLDGPLRSLCAEARAPELYGRFLDRLRGHLSAIDPSGLMLRDVGYPPKADA